MEIEDLMRYAKNSGVPIMQDEGISFILKYISDHSINKILEIGTAIGYSAIQMALTSQTIKIDTIEINEELFNKAKIHVETFNLENQINVHLGDALEYPLSSLSNSYDLIFVDAAKAQYQKFVERYEELLAFNGTIIVDNIDFHGMVNDIENVKNRNTKQLVKKILRFKNWFIDNEKYNVKYYTIGDGILVGRKN